MEFHRSSHSVTGNLLPIGNIANLIVADGAKSPGVRVTWSEHARTGVPVTLFALALAAKWLWLNRRDCNAGG